MTRVQQGIVAVILALAVLLAGAVVAFRAATQQNTPVPTAQVHPTATP